MKSDPKWEEVLSCRCGLLKKMAYVIDKPNEFSYPCPDCHTNDKYRFHSFTRTWK